ncbi:MAG TPA: SpoIIE family protein phosphatase [bacterium]|nr:SpoIIE family protein phosphatase [bacterium]
MKKLKDVNFKNFKLKIKFQYQMIFVFLFVGIGTIIIAQSIFQRVVEKRMIDLAVSDIKQYVIPNFRDLIILAIKQDDDIILANSARRIRYYQNITSFVITDETNRIIVSNKSEEINKIHDLNLYGYFKDNLSFSLSDASTPSIDQLYIKRTANEIAVYYHLKFQNRGMDIQRKIFINISKEFVNTAISELKMRFTIIGIGVGILIIIFGVLFSEKLSTNVVKIKEAANIIGSGNFDYKININTIISDEIIELSSDINKMADSLKTAEAAKLQNERIEQELKIAEQIQQTLLPNSKPAIENYQFGSIYYSAKEVGGDYYDWIIIDDKHIGIVCADVAGKGVPGAFVMAITRSILQSYAPSFLSPGELLKKLNALLKKDMKKGMFVTMWYGILNIETGVLKFANAGHNPLLIYRYATKDIESIPTQGSPLGILSENLFNKKLKEIETIMNINDIAVQYTDGVTEAFNANKEMFEEERLLKVIKENGDSSSADEMIEKINGAVQDFVAGYEQSDDILIMTIKKTL